MTLFLDTSALLKLVVEEAESTALADAVDGRRRLASALVLTELPRAFVRRVPGAPLDGVEAVLRGLALVDLDRSLLREAGALPGVDLRSLDAVHLACALRVRDALESVVVYDHRLRDAARTAGLPVSAPGAAQD